jgi:hypothetical protein
MCYGLVKFRVNIVKYHVLVDVHLFHHLLVDFAIACSPKIFWNVILENFERNLPLKWIKSNEVHSNVMRHLEMGPIHFIV